MRADRYPDRVALEPDMDGIYLDYNATTPIDPAVAEAMLPYVHGLFGNPSSGHAYGLAAREGVEHARQQVAAMLSCSADDLIFTSGGTEANNHAIKGVIGAHRQRGSHIITSAVEHPAVTEVCRYLEAYGVRTTYLPVDEFGVVDPRQVEESITPETVLVTIMHANNEVGTIQPIAEIAEIAHRHGVLVHSDCAQSVGKIPVKVDDLGVDLLSVAGHKLYAPRASVPSTSVPASSWKNSCTAPATRATAALGTENIILMAGLGKACELIERNLAEYAGHMAAMRDRLEQGLLASGHDARVNGHPTERLPNTCSIGFRGREADGILAGLPTVAASAGAACHSDQVELSHVLEAMRVPTEYAMGTLRLTVGRYTTEEEIDQALAEITDVVANLSPVHAAAN